MSRALPNINIGTVREVTMLDCNDFVVDLWWQQLKVGTWWRRKQTAYKVAIQSLSPLFHRRHPTEHRIIESLSALELVPFTIDSSYRYSWSTIASPHLPVY
ncbi:hypothetical protein PILCRDRAFT_818107 [Piloderma croceum F 1598]|uniref:Uncharacterized protein n=1 Tax=Piloderma croceum (strain F 1598) TaxID=765440 RepID=A0A0C3BDZ4_PILCF|nr:hypothetical protein PILCRDRAFT_818107 [Piloderma croceum F 1598]